MANQPTKYRKFVVGAASAALVASAVAPVVSAATFSDTKGNTHEEAINALSEAGVITGYPDGTFKPNKTLTRSDVVKLMGKWLISKGYEVPTDYKTKPRFADLKTTSNDELLKMSALVYDNGLFVGKPDGTLDASGDITRENMAIVLVRAFDRVHDIDLVSYVKAQDFKKDVTDLGKAKAEARPAIDVLDFFDITNPAAPQFNPKSTTTRGQFATFVYKTANTDFSKVTGGTTANGVAKVTGVNNTTVEVTFKEKVDNIDSLKFTINGLTVSNAAIKQTDDKTVVLTTASQKGGEKYTVTMNDKEIGTFTGIEAVVPTSIKLTAGNNQAKVGDQVILSADVGQKTAGIPVTFNIDAPLGSLNKDQVVEVMTNAEGIATYSYTQYSPDADSITVYPTGAPQLRDFATVYWGKETILTIEESKATAGNVLANGVKKTYTAIYKDPKTGQPLANRKLNVTFVENLNVPFNAISKATVTNPATGITVTPYQTSTGLKETIQITTDSEGKATFIVSGTNTSVTPAVFVDGSRAGFYTGNTGWGSGTDTLDYANGLWESTELTVTAPKVKFEGAQLQSQITVTRDGEEEAAAVYGSKLNGREYSIKVNDKDGKAYANGLVNVSLDEIMDRNVSTNSNAKFANVDKSDALYDFTKNNQQAKIKLDSKGEAKFVLYGAKGDVGTPVVWIDQNTSENNQSGVLEEGEPFFKAPATNFQYERVIGGKLTLEGKTSDQNIKRGDDVANYLFALTNQSGEELENLEGKMTYEIRNTSGQPIVVNVPNAAYKTQDNKNVTANYRIEEYGSITITASVTSKAQTALNISAANADQPATVVVTPSFVTVDKFNASNDNGAATDNRDFNKYVTAKALQATFILADGIPAFAPGATVEWANVSKNTLKLKGYAGIINFENADLSILNSNIGALPATGYTNLPLSVFKDYISENDVITFTKGADGKHVIKLEVNNAGKNDGTTTPGNANDVVVKAVAKTLTVGGATVTLTANDLATSNNNLPLNLTGAASTSDATVATATTTNNNLVITPVGKGTANVTVSVTDGSITKIATVAVTVNEAGATVNFNTIGASNKIQSDGLGSNLASFLKSQLAPNLQGTSYELKIGNKTYNFVQSNANADRYYVTVPQSEATEAQINAGSFIVKK
ncbi:S-layer homology domain-containing protein [Sporosarcina sp. PTS2304]|uniref:S-layer homology domain-containing protein n=1 Tax=Sporosarcina sp. PTS2304 TaxID=2283194 RepID=UPI000E0D79E1|nr:S-layer homology domain-containing protein [Sporosarcina sp. PTS2304]AXI01181.1 S-layer homology domain-containing protein [Sporosarcina sp. PTS2304]